MTASTFKPGDRVRVTGNPGRGVGIGEIGIVQYRERRGAEVVVLVGFPQWRTDRHPGGLLRFYDVDALELVVAVADLPTRLDELQAGVGAWHRERWGTADRTTMAAKLAEEVGEVCEAAVKQAQGHPDAADLDYGAELGDVVIVALAAADLAGYNLTDTVLVKLARLGALGHREIDR